MSPGGPYRANVSPGGHFLSTFVPVRDHSDEIVSFMIPFWPEEYHLCPFGNMDSDDCADGADGKLLQYIYFLKKDFSYQVKK